MKNRFPLLNLKRALTADWSFTKLRNSGLAFAVAFTIFATGCSKEVATITPKKKLADVATLSKQIAAHPISLFGLGTAGNFAILSKAGVTATAGSTVIGNVGVGPIASTAITGFGLVSDPSSEFSTSAIVTKGRIFGPDYAAPTPSIITKAVADMEAAFELNSANGNSTRIPADLSGVTLFPGTYYIPAAYMSAGGTLTLDGLGDEGAQFIFQTESSLTLGANTSIVCTDSATPENILWVVGSAATFGTNVNFAGTILAKTAVTLNTDDIIHGQIFAQTAVTMTGSHIESPVSW